MKTVTVPLENYSYDILIGEDLISNFPSYLGPLLSREFLAIVTDKNIENLHLSNLVKVLSKAGVETKILCQKKDGDEWYPEKEILVEEEKKITLRVLEKAQELSIAKDLS